MACHANSLFGIEFNHPENYYRNDNKLKNKITPKNYSRIKLHKIKFTINKRSGKT